MDYIIKNNVNTFREWNENGILEKHFIFSNNNWYDTSMNIIQLYEKDCVFDINK